MNTNLFRDPYKRSDEAVQAHDALRETMLGFCANKSGPDDVIQAMQDLENATMGCKRLMAVHLLMGDLKRVFSTFPALQEVSLQFISPIFPGEELGDVTHCEFDVIALSVEHTGVGDKAVQTGQVERFLLESGTHSEYSRLVEGVDDGLAGDLTLTVKRAQLPKSDSISESGRAFESVAPEIYEQMIQLLYPVGDFSRRHVDLAPAESDVRRPQFG